MRDDGPECRLRLGDRVRWRFDGHEDESYVGIVRSLRRKFPRSPELSTDSVEIYFDEQVHLVEGMEGFAEHWVPAVHVELLMEKNEQPRSVTK